MQIRRIAGYTVLSVIGAFILSACGGGGGDSAPPPALAPTVQTSTINVPSLDNALVNGIVTPNGLETTAWFEYGLDNTLSILTKTADQKLGPGTVPTSINATLMNLSAGTTYYYRVVARSSAGTSTGSVVSLNTLSLPPTATTLPAENITINSATLKGEVNPNGLTTTAWFEYDEDSSFTTLTKTADQLMGAGKTTLSIPSAALSLLTPSTTYYYRAVAQNASGPPIRGAIRNFITSANPPPAANAGPDQSVIMGQTVTLDGSGSSDGGNGGSITYQWTQVSGTPVTIANPTTANPTFTAPVVSYPSGILVFQVTVTSSRGPSATDNVQVIDKWGFIDDFSKDSTAQYTIQKSGTVGTFTYDSIGKRVHVTTGNDNGLAFTRSNPPSNTGVFSLDFNPTTPYPTHGGIWIRLKQDANNYYEIKNFDWASFGGTPSGNDVAGVRRISGGAVADTKTFTTGYNQGGTYHIKITFSTTQVIMEAFGLTITLPITGNFTVNSFEVDTGQQDAYYDNITLEAVP